MEKSSPCLPPVVPMLTEEEGFIHGLQIDQEFCVTVTEVQHSMDDSCQPGGHIFHDSSVVQGLIDRKRERIVPNGSEYDGILYIPSQDTRLREYT